MVSSTGKSAKKVATVEDFSLNLINPDCWSPTLHLEARRIVFFSLLLHRLQEVSVVQLGSEMLEMWLKEQLWFNMMSCFKNITVRSEMETNPTKYFIFLYPVGFLPCCWTDRDGVNRNPPSGLKLGIFPIKVDKSLVTFHTTNQFIK